MSTNLVRSRKTRKIKMNRQLKQYLALRELNSEFKVKPTTKNVRSPCGCMIGMKNMLKRNKHLAQIIRVKEMA